jgi:pyridoxamine 5'-phosphate oxidase
MTDYIPASLGLEQLHPSDPIETFKRWFNHATNCGLVESPDVAVLSTGELPSGRISSRTVQIKDVDPKGFIILSNFETSKKSRDLSTNPQVSLNFWWEKLSRQVRVEGITERLTLSECEAFARGRLRNSRICDWASPQSAVIKDRAELESSVHQVQERFMGVDEIPVPHFWGGLRVIPDVVEFWQGLMGFFWYMAHQFRKTESPPRQICLHKTN